jgi:hypothetical protein
MQKRIMVEGTSSTALFFSSPSQRSDMEEVKKKEGMG